MMLNPCIYCKSNERLEFIEVSTLNFTNGIAVECSLCGCRGMAANAEDGEEIAARLWNDLHVISEDKPTSWVCGECGYQNNGFRKVCGGCHFSGHAENCVLRSGGYACTCGAEMNVIKGDLFFKSWKEDIAIQVGDNHIIILPITHEAIEVLTEAILYTRQEIWKR